MSEAPDVIVFTGPTLPAEAGRAIVDATFLPPARQGDVYRAATRRPAAIALIDGYFERVPAVWHKEVLFALTEGISVFGAASMGALRAAELAPFGMIGVGAVYDAYASGAIEDDDEVAVAHGSAEDGYPAFSEAMVNIRATIDAALQQGVVSPGCATCLVDLAKTRFYPDRTWPTLLDDAAIADLPAAELTALRTWLPEGRVDQKRLDAEALLRRVAAGFEPPQPRFRLERSVWWDHLTRHAPWPAGRAGSLDGILDELRLEGAYGRVTTAGLLRHLLLAEADREGDDAGDDEVRGWIADLRGRRGLLDRVALDEWLASQDLTPADLVRLARQELRIEHVASDRRAEALAQLTDQLTVDPTYDRLRSRLADKEMVLAALGRENPGLDELGLTGEELVAWHAGQLGVDTPTDVANYAATLGFADTASCLRALAREHAYQQVEGSAALRGTDR